ncbi:hypothetical protein Stsp02_73190 [Streptomyces sp. NBRC 14336]|nr:hypothetical protein Stsp02_73190 [Streptomyces sp. NBRC 14336]
MTAGTVVADDRTSSPTAAHLASSAGLTRGTKSSRISIHCEHAPRGANRQLKRTMFLSAFAALHDSAASLTYYDRCRLEKDLYRSLLYVRGCAPSVYPAGQPRRRGLTDAGRQGRPIPDPAEPEQFTSGPTGGPFVAG